MSMSLQELFGRTVNQGRPEQLTTASAQRLGMINVHTPDAMLLILMGSRDQLERVHSLIHEHHDALVVAMDAM